MASGPTIYSHPIALVEIDIPDASVGRLVTLLVSRHFASEESDAMGLKAALVATRILEGIFFCGLVGCAVVVVLSWWSILFKSGFDQRD